MHLILLQNLPIARKNFYQGFILITSLLASASQCLKRRRVLPCDWRFLSAWIRVVIKSSLDCSNDSAASLCCSCQGGPSLAQTPLSFWIIENKCAFNNYTIWVCISCNLTVLRPPSLARHATPGDLCSSGTRRGWGAGQLKKPVLNSRPRRGS